MAIITEVGNPSNSYSFKPLEVWEFTPIVLLNKEPTDYDRIEDIILLYNVDEKVELSDKLSTSISSKYTLMEFTTELDTLTLSFIVKNGTTDQFYDEDGYIKPQLTLIDNNNNNKDTKNTIEITKNESFLIDYDKKETTEIEVDISIKSKNDISFYVDFYANDDKKYFDVEGAYKNVFCGRVKIIYNTDNEWQFSLNEIEKIKTYAITNNVDYRNSFKKDRKDRKYTDYHHCTDTHKNIVYQLLNNPTDLYLGENQTKNRKTPRDYEKAGESTTHGVRNRLIASTYAESSKNFTVIDINNNEVLNSGQAGNTDVKLSKFKESPVVYMKNKCPKDGYYIFIGAYNDDYHSFTIVANKRGENINFIFIDQVVGISSFTESNFEKSKLLRNIDSYSFDYPMKLELFQLRNKKK